MAQEFQPQPTKENNANNEQLKNIIRQLNADIESLKKRISILEAK